MINAGQTRDGKKLLRDGWSDEDVERFTGLTLANIVLLRAEAAAAVPDPVQPWAPWPAPPRRSRA